MCVIDCKFKMISLIGKVMSFKCLFFCDFYGFYGLVCGAELFFFEVF